MMTRNWSIACAIAVASIVFPTIARATWLDDLNHHLSGDSAVPTQTQTQTMPYGTGDGLTSAQSAALPHIAFPQSYPAMISRFGYPDARDARADYYDMASGRRVAVVYSGRSAVSVEGL
jgi:hypothetical protein